jgi:hypothetical protein
VRRAGRLLPALAAALLAGCTGGGGDPAPATPTPGATAGSTLRWASCALPGDGGTVNAVAPGGQGMPWTAVGQERRGTEIRPAVWTSADGCGWRRAAVQPVTPDGERSAFTAVVRRGRLVVALGAAYSRVHGNARPTLWRAGGTAPLREVELLRELFGGESGISVVTLAAVPAGVLAVGSYVSPDKYVAVQLWRTTDGADWRRLPPDRDLVSSRTTQLLPRDLVAGPAGPVVVGTAFELSGGLRNGFDGAAWYGGADGGRWRRAGLDGTGLVGTGDQRLLAAAALPDRYVALARVPSGSGLGLRSVVSPDGRAWSAGEALPLEGALPSGNLPAADVASAPGRSALAGTVTGGRPLLWRSGDGRRWQPEAVPLPAGQAASGLVLTGAGDRVVLVVQTAAGSRAYLGR